ARKLTFALRARGAGEEMIADVLKDCRARELDDDVLEARNGSPTAYADRLTRDLVRTNPGRVFMACLAVSFGWLLVATLMPALGWWDPRQLLQEYVMVPAFVLIALGGIGQHVSDYYRPVR